MRSRGRHPGSVRPLRRLALTLGLLACVSAAVAETPSGIPAGRDFGAALELSETTPLDEVLAAPERFTEQPTLVRGRLADVCQRKGCWTVLSDGAKQVRVRFQDYGFFLPKDSIGAEAFVEGVVTIRTLSEEDARHYEAESRNGDPGSIRGPQREVGFLASGVRIVGREVP